MFVWDKPWPGAIKKMFCSGNSQNFCFQPIIFEHFTISMGVENILRFKNILKFMASGHACLLVWDKKKDTFHIMLFAGIFSAFNKRWNTLVGRKHPNLWYFIRKMRAEELRTSNSIMSCNRGDPPPPPRKRKYRLLQDRINRLQRAYRRGQRPLNEYWDAMIHTVARFN
jgi:hypothetical protein